MTERTKNKLVVLSMAFFFLFFFAWCLGKPADAVSDSERRPLASRPSISVSGLISGKFMQDFESYATDQFPLRNQFRTLKSLVTFSVMRQGDMGGIYVAGGYASKLEYPMKTASLDNAAAKFESIRSKYLEGKDVNVYLAIIPDKNYFLAKASGHPAMDYEAFVSYLREKIGGMHYIDIFDCLELSDYYKTDTHWRQEKITDVAERLAEGMGVTLSEQYTVKTLDHPFHGVYYGQSALPLAADQISYLESDVFDSCVVYDYETEAEIDVYDMEKAVGKDPYEIFLAGPKSLLRIQNPKASTDRKLIIFRDSFGSSIAPLLFESYAEVTLIDIRYFSSLLLGRYVEFDNCDVLFLYSTLVLNNSETLK